MANDKFATYVGAAALAVGAAVPLLVLLPLGWLWLWENGYALYWLGGALVVSLMALGLRAWLLRRLTKELRAETAGPDVALGSPREIAARAAVEALAKSVDPERITDRDSLARLGIETVEAVAAQMHPEVKEPIWNFTVPEALALVERVSQRLRPLVMKNVPLGDKLTVGQVMQLYKWRKLVEVAGSAYDIWRVIRLMNPIAAATQEIRERVSRAMYEGLREELAKRLAGAYVREVGRAAIDLYSGRLTIENGAADDANGHASDDAETDVLPLRILIAGRTGNGKSSLVNALAAEVRAPTDALPQTQGFTDYEVQRDGMPAVVLTDSPGVARVEDAERIAVKAARCDLLIWVMAADRPDRALDRSGLDAVLHTFAANPHRSSPPILIVLTGIDRLRPFGDWSPPYDVVAPTVAKGRSIRDAVQAAADDLARPVSDFIPTSLAAGREAYNVDLVWAKVVEALPAAKSAQLLRRVSEARGGVNWRRLLDQAVSAGRLATTLALRGRVD